MAIRTALLMIALLATGACGVSRGEPLPGGYSVSYADRGKAWLVNPDGTTAHAALIKQLFKRDGYVLLVTYAATYGGKVEGPRPLDGNCYIALLIETDRQQVRQVRLAEAHQLAAKMELVASYARGCVQGMAVS
jgi:hypothetical protein